MEEEFDGSDLYQEQIQKQNLQEQDFQVSMFSFFNTRVKENLTQTIFRKILIKFWLVNKLTITLYKGENRSPK